MSTFNLNEKQKMAVTYDGNKPLIIKAGPGSGKTRVLTERVKFLLNVKKVDPESLLVITFSRKAAEELKTRLAEDIDSEIINKMQISTIHSFCYELLKKYDNFSYEILDDDYNQKKTLFVQKNKMKLGFINEYYIRNAEIEKVLDKYGEYSTFKVNDGLVDYIKENRPISDEYIQFIKHNSSNGFPYGDVMDDGDLKDNWYNAKYYQIANSYNDYLDLLDKNYLVDYDTLQIKALEFLEQKPKTVFKNILIDEFQDTNPVQYYIFEILLKNADSFTVVGDIDQRIYGFRGATIDYFEVLNDNYDSQIISLDKNYRSSENIINTTECFIEKHRENDFQDRITHSRKYNNENFYIVNENEEDEAVDIFNYVKTLKEEGKIESYDDIAILWRTLKAKSLKSLISLFDDEGIPYQVKDFADIYSNEGIKSFITLLHYIIPLSSKPHMFNSWEKEWLNLRAFTKEDFEPTLWELSDETSKLLVDLQGEFEKSVMDTEKIVYNEITGKSSKLKSFKGVFNRDEEVLIEIFNRVSKPEVPIDLIENEEDRKFFETLEELKEIVYKNVGSEILTKLDNIKSISKVDIKKVPYRLDTVKDLVNQNDELAKTDILNRIEIVQEKLSKGISLDELYLDIDYMIKIVEDKTTSLTILDIFYKILDLSNFFDIADKQDLNNFSIISESIYNFENVMSNTDIVGYYYFLKNNIKNWMEKSVHDEGIQIMTIHKSKGLEFPVVILPSIKDKSFPKIFLNPAEKDHIYGSPTFYTPNECLDYKKDLDKSDEYYHNMEELRIIYVALTRAQDTILVSFIGDVHEEFKDVVDEDLLKPLDFNFLDKCESIHSIEGGGVLNASYTSLKTYEECPYKYQLLYDLKFKISDNENILMGSVVHDTFNKINVKMIDNPKITKEEVDETIEDIFYSASNISHDEADFLKFKNSIWDFYNTYDDFELKESEYSFSLIKNNYNIIGSIDLIYEKDGELFILDYKNTSLKKESADYYKDQLMLYMYALSLDSNYADKKFSKACIYAIESRELLEIEISQDEIKDYIEKIEGIVEKIKDEEFTEKRGYHCNRCDFEFICN